MKKEIGRLSTIRENKVGMELVKQEKFAGNEVDLYKDAEGNVFMTIDQLANALEYSGRKSVEKIIERNNYLCNKEFSVTDRLSAADNKLYDTRLLTEDGIYEITMLSKQPKAQEFRFFIRQLLKGLRKGELQIEQKASYQIDDPIERAKKWIEEEEKRQQLQLENEEMKPKALFSDAVSASETSILIGALAKLIKQNGINIGQNRLYEWLRQNGYLVKRKGDMYNSPTQRSMDIGLFEVKVRTIVNPDDTVRTTRTTMVTGKGQIYFVNKFVGGGGQ